MLFLIFVPFLSSVLFLVRVIFLTIIYSPSVSVWPVLISDLLPAFITSLSSLIMLRALLIYVVQISTSCILFSSLSFWLMTIVQLIYIFSIFLLKSLNLSFRIPPKFIHIVSDWPIMFIATLVRSLIPQPTALSRAPGSDN